MAHGVPFGFFSVTAFGDALFLPGQYDLDNLDSKGANKHVCFLYNQVVSVASDSI